MNSREHILYMLKTNQQVFKKLLEDITEDESMVRDSAGGSHIKWLVGHLVYSNAYALSLLGDQSVNFEEHAELFGAGTEPVDDTSTYPPFSTLKLKLFVVSERAIEQVDSMSDTAFEQAVGSEGNEKPLWQTATFFCLHEFYHAGQITTIRRLIGRDRPFG